MLRGRTDGTLHAPQTFPASDFASTPSLGDLNGDGRPDLVVAAGDQADLTGLRGFFVYVNLTGPSVPPPGGDDDGDPDTLTWQRTINVEVDGNGVRKSMGCDGCFDGIATAEPALATDGAVEFTVVDPARILMAGLATADVANSPAALAYGLFVQGGGWVEVREQGAYRTDTRIAAGDRLRISTSDDVGAYAKNGEVFYTSTVATAPPLHFHVFLAHIGAAIEDVRLSAAGSQPPQPPPANGTPTWTQSANVLVSADVVRKTDGCDGCFDGFAVTDQVIAVEGGAVEFRIEDPSRLLIAGLTTEFGGTSPASIDYGLFVQGAGWVEVRESGAYRSDVRIEAGDTLRIGVDQGVVSYALNGAVFHTSTEPAVGDMVFVVVPASLDAAVVDVTIW